MFRIFAYIYNLNNSIKTMITTTTYQYKQPKGGKTLNGLIMSYSEGQEG
jgi:hypothetical protein